MKKFVLFFSLLLVTGLLAINHADALNNQKDNGNKSVVTTVEWTDYWQPIYCNGVMIDYLTGTVTVHNIELYKNGINIGGNSHVYGEVTSNNGTGEVFKLHENDKGDWIQGTVTWHFNLKGNMGSHYIGSMTWDLVTGEITVHKAMCVGNKK